MACPPAANSSVLKTLDWIARKIGEPRPSSSMNAQLYVRGHRLDYDTWRDVHGCTGWGYADLLPYFLRAEDNARGGSDYHAVGGPLRVEDPRFTHELCHAFVESAVQYGIERNDDCNGPRQDGAGLFQVTQRSGR